MANSGAVFDDSPVDEFDDGEDISSRNETDPPNSFEDLAPVDLWDECLRTVMEGCSSPNSQNETENTESPEKETSASIFTGNLSIGPRQNDSDDEFERVSSRSPLHSPKLFRDGGIYKSTYNSSFFENTSGGAFCNCYASDCLRKWKDQACTCGEDDQDFDWVWDENGKSWACYLQRDQREVRFHKHYSSGTATVRGNKPLVKGQHYWEIKMISPVYGTDMMIGIGTAEADLNRDSTTFCSFLGSNAETWGLSYTGVFHHAGKSKHFSARFGQGAIIGVHLDTWKGTLSFYKNRKLIGVACEGLTGKTLFPMVSSTAARSGMRMVKSCSYNSSLKYFSLQAIRGRLPDNRNLLDTLSLPPGLAVYLRNNLSWLLGPPQCHRAKNRCQHSSKIRCLACQETSTIQTELFLENQIISPDFPNSERYDLINASSESSFGSYSYSRKKQTTNMSDDEESVRARPRPKRRCFQTPSLQTEGVSSDESEDGSYVDRDILL